MIYIKKQKSPEGIIYLLEVQYPNKLVQGIAVTQKQLNSLNKKMQKYLK